MADHAFGTEITAPGLHSYLERRVNSLPRDGGVLDLGCGAGAWLRRLEAMGFRDLVGVDRYTEPVETDNISIRVVPDLEAPDIGLGDRKFGLVTMVEVIEHMTNPGMLLAHAARHVADGGYVMVTTPNIHSLIQRLKFLVTGRFGHFDAGSDPTHFQPVVLGAWERMLPNWGLYISDTWTFPEANRFGGISKAWQYGAALLGPVIGNPLPGESLGIFLRKGGNSGAA